LGGDSPEGSLRVSDFDYDLPAELIAQVPAERRDAARLLVLNRSGERVRHSTVRDLSEFLQAGDLLVLNDTRVRPARLLGHGPGGGSVELLLVRQEGAKTWHCLGKPARRLRVGARVLLPDGGEVRVQASLGDGRYLVEFAGDVEVADLLELHGEVPLPPYIRRPDGTTRLDRDRYQTVFASQVGAVAAPTAGLHFTDALLDEIRGCGVETVWVTLHVGPATFLPVRRDDVQEHEMEGEWANVPEATAAAIELAKREGRRVIAVGTTTTRTLESAAKQWGEVRGGEFWADVFIYPGFQFEVVDALLTNFHLPRSTLLMLVSAFAKRDRILAAYEEAVRERYRFYSYGDAMLIL